jgi:hypothetical protein
VSEPVGAQASVPAAAQNAHDAQITNEPFSS